MAGSMRASKIDGMISELESLERIDGNSESFKQNAIQYLKLYADYLDNRGIKTIKKCPGEATPNGHMANKPLT